MALIDKHHWFSKSGISIIISLLSLPIGLAFFNSSTTLIIPGGESLGAPLVFALFFSALFIPFMIAWVVTIALLLYKALNKSNKSIKILVILLLVTVILFPLALNKTEQLFTLPFIGYKNAPITIFEKSLLENKYNFHLYIPRVIPKNLRPYFKRVSDVYGISFVYQEIGRPIGNYPLEITEKKGTSLEEVRNQIKNGEVKYKIIPLPSNSSTLWYQTENNDNDNIYRLQKNHYVIIEGVQVSFKFSPYYPAYHPSEDEMIKIAESLK